jgi:Flp pilus assembly protein TadD
MNNRIGLALLAAACLVGPGCASLPNFGFHRPRFVAIRPIAPAPSAEPKQAMRSAYYQSAVRAIDQRDYALALDLLQAARARDPQDAAVMNAFGVVYDKLGRFDLSARYYTQAAALDPDSPIVRQNLAYSERLQGKWAPASPATALAVAVPAPSQPAAPSPAAPTLAVAQPLLGAITTAQPMITIAQAPSSGITVAVAPNGVLLTGRALEIVDASGSAGGAEAVRQQLVSRGWSAPKSAVRVATAESRTRIVFPEGSLAVAEALARTLPFPVQLAACHDRCGGLSLVVGEDAAGRLKARS